MSMFTTIRLVAVSAAALATFGIVSAASAAEPAVANSSAAASSDSQGSSAPSQTPEMKYCVSSNVTGSRIPQRSCKTKAEWAAEGVTVELKSKH